MRISLLSGSTVYPLAGDAGVSERAHSSAGDFQMSPQANQQLASYVRAENAVPIDRGNLLETVTFSTTRLFSTAAEAWLYLLDYDRTMPRSGTLLLDSVVAGGWVARRHLLNAVVSPPSRRCVGATVQLSYSVSGSEIVEGGTHASGTVVFTGLPTAGQTVTVGDRTYTWASSLTAADQIKLGATADACAFNLATALAPDSAQSGVLYGAGTAPHDRVTCNIPLSSTLTILSLLPGTVGNTIGISETSSNCAVSATTLTGGAE